MDKRTYRTRIEAAYRKSAFRVISALHKMSTDAGVVIVGIMPLKLAVDVERRKHDTRRGIHLSNCVQLMDDAMDKCQQD